MLKNHLIIDNFFDDPDAIRKIALSRYYRYGGKNNGGWKGERTFQFQDLGNICRCCQQEISSEFQTEQNLLVKESDKIFDICVKHFDVNRQDITITSYFHITTTETEDCLPFFAQDKLHQDSCLLAGVVYLTPDAPPNAGTSILYVEENEMVSLENKYNRLIAYEGHRIHGISNVFGKLRETGRLTLTYFIHHVDDILEAY